MSTDTPEAGTPPGTRPATSAGTSPDARRAQVAPLLAAGLSVRAIAAETGIPVGAVHRAKRQVEKAWSVLQGQQTAALPKPPSSYVVQRVINGVRQDVRELTISVYESKVREAIGRGLLSPDDRDKAGAIISALFAASFSDHTIRWLHKPGYPAWGEGGLAGAIIAGVNDLIERQR